MNKLAFILLVLSIFFGPLFGIPVIIFGHLAIKNKLNYKSIYLVFSYILLVLHIGIIYYGYTIFWNTEPHYLIEPYVDKSEPSSQRTAED